MLNSFISHLCRIVVAVTHYHLQRMQSSSHMILASNWLLFVLLVLISLTLSCYIVLLSHYYY